MSDLGNDPKKILKALSSEIYWKEYPAHTGLWLWKLAQPPESKFMARGWSRLPGPKISIPPAYRRLFGRLAWFFTFVGAGLSENAIYIDHGAVKGRQRVTYEENADNALTHSALKVAARQVLKSLSKMAAYSNASSSKTWGDCYTRLGVATTTFYWIVRGAVLSTIFEPMHESLLSKGKDLKKAWQHAKNCYAPAVLRKPQPITNREERMHDAQILERFGLNKTTRRQRIRPSEGDETGVLVLYLDHFGSQVAGRGPYALPFRGLPLFNYQGMRKEFNGLSKLYKGSHERGGGGLLFMAEKDWDRIGEVNMTEHPFEKWMGYLYPESKLQTSSAWRTSDAEKLRHEARRKVSPATKRPDKSNKPLE